jgi:ribonuclease BN (tRNA processing enzyme)
MEATILSNLWQVGGPGFTSPRDAAVYLIRFGEKAVLIDAGCGGAHEALKRNIDRYLDENDGSGIFISHPLSFRSYGRCRGGSRGIRLPNCQPRF